MDFILLYRRIKDIFMNPTSMWRDVKDENRTVSEVRTSLLFPLAILISLAGFIGNTLSSYSGLSFLYPLIIAIRYLLVFVITVEVTSRVITEIALIISPIKSFTVNYKLVLYSFTPFMVSMFFSRLFPSLLFINLGGLYGFYIAWRGIEILTDTPQDSRLKYTAIVSVATIVFYFAISFLFKELIDGLYYSNT
jgi:hypothetical protein